MADDIETIRVVVPTPTLIRINVQPQLGLGATPGGSNHQVQFNNAGVLGGASNLTYDGAGNITMADGTKLFLIGASSLPDVSGSQWPWSTSKLFIAGATADVPAALAIVGAYRTGMSGERASTYFGPDGEMYTNRFIILGGYAYNNTVDPSAMLVAALDTPVGIVVKSEKVYNFDAGGSYFYTAVGKSNAANNFIRCFSVNTQGTLELDNVYGTVHYALPNLVIGEIHDPNSPAWTYGSLAIDNGTISLGTYNPAGPTQNKELQITSGNVAIAAGTTTTQSANDNSTKLASTAYVDRAVSTGTKIYGDAPNSTINIATTSGSPQDIVRKTLTYTAGDQVTVTIWGTIVNNSGGNRTYSVVFGLGSGLLSDTAAFAAVISSSATNRTTLTIEFKLGVHSSGSAWMNGRVLSGAAANLGVAAGLGGSFTRFISDQTTSNCTGSQATFVQMFADANTTTQSFELNAYKIEQIPTNP